MRLFEVCTKHPKQRFTKTARRALPVLNETVRPRPLRYTTTTFCVVTHGKECRFQIKAEEVRAAEQWAQETLTKTLRRIGREGSSISGLISKTPSHPRSARPPLICLKQDQPPRLSRVGHHPLLPVPPPLAPLPAYSLPLPIAPTTIQRQFHAGDPWGGIGAFGHNPNIDAIDSLKRDWIYETVSRMQMILKGSSEPGTRAAPSALLLDAVL